MNKILYSFLVVSSGFLLAPERSPSGPKRFPIGHPAAPSDLGSVNKI